MKKTRLKIFGFGVAIFAAMVCGVFFYRNFLDKVPGAKAIGDCPEASITVAPDSDGNALLVLSAPDGMIESYPTLTLTCPTGFVAYGGTVSLNDFSFGGAVCGYDIEANEGYFTGNADTSGYVIANSVFYHAPTASDSVIFSMTDLSNSSTAPPITCTVQIGDATTPPFQTCAVTAQNACPASFQNPSFYYRGAGSYRYITNDNPPSAPSTCCLPADDYFSAGHQIARVGGCLTLGGSQCDYTTDIPDVSLTCPPAGTVNVGRGVALNPAGGSGIYSFSTPSLGSISGAVYTPANTGSETITVSDSYNLSNTITCNFTVAPPLPVTIDPGQCATAMAARYYIGDPAHSVTLNATGGTVEGNYEIFSSLETGRITDGTTHEFRVAGSQTLTVEDAALASNTDTCGPFPNVFATHLAPPVCPAGPLYAGQAVSFTPSGGSGNYTVTVNGDGGNGTYNTSTRQYVPATGDTSLSVTDGFDTALSCTLPTSQIYASHLTVSWPGGVATPPLTTPFYVTDPVQLAISGGSGTYTGVATPARTGAFDAATERYTPAVNDTKLTVSDGVETKNFTLPPIFATHLAVPVLPATPLYAGEPVTVTLGGGNVGHYTVTVLPIRTTGGGTFDPATSRYTPAVGDTGLRVHDGYETKDTAAFSVKRFEFVNCPDPAHNNLFGALDADRTFTFRAKHATGAYYFSLSTASGVISPTAGDSVVYTAAADYNLGAPITLSVTDSAAPMPHNATCTFKLTPTCDANFGLYHNDEPVVSKSVFGRAVYRFFIRHSLVFDRYGLTLADDEHVVQTVTRGVSPLGSYVDVVFKDDNALRTKTASITVTDTVVEANGNPCAATLSFTHQGQGIRKKDTPARVNLGATGF